MCVCVQWNLNTIVIDNHDNLPSKFMNKLFSKSHKYILFCFELEVILPLYVLSRMYFMLENILLITYHIYL